MEKLPFGYSLNEKGQFIHKLPKEEVLEMRKTDNLIFTLAVLNIVQALFIVILVLSHFCNH